MTTELQQPDTPGFSRRTALRAAAWSVPVIAAAAAVPAYAASVEAVDLMFEPANFGESFVAYSPDGARQCTIPHATPMLISNAGTADLAAGSVLTLTYDARYFGDAGASIEGTALPAMGAPTTAGNVTTARFTLPAFAAGAPAVLLSMGATLLHEPTALPWHEDVENATMVATVVGAVDANPDNNTIVDVADYDDVTDIAVTAATWGTTSVPNAQNAGAPFEIDVPETFTVTSISGGPLSTMTINLGLAQAQDATGSTVGPLFESRTISRAVIDGVDVRDKITQPYANAPEVSRVEGISFAPGQTLEVALTVTLTSSPVDGVTSNGGAYVAAYAPNGSDSNSDNDSVYSPKHPNA